MKIGFAKQIKLRRTYHIHSMVYKGRGRKHIFWTRLPKSNISVSITDYSERLKKSVFFICCGGNSYSPCDPRMLLGGFATSIFCIWRFDISMRVTLISVVPENALFLFIHSAKQSWLTMEKFLVVEMGIVDKGLKTLRN